MKYFFVFTWIATILGFDLWNWYIIERLHLPVNHGRQLIYRILVALGASVGIFFYSKDWFELVNFQLFQWLSFIMLFNIVLNKARRKEIFYTSNNNADKALRWIFNKTGPEFFYWCVFVASLLFAYNYIIGVEEFNKLMGWHLTGK